MRIGVPTGVINGFDFVAMDIHKSLACEKKREWARESREVRRKTYEREWERKASSIGLPLDLGAAAGPKDVKHEKKAERWETADARGKVHGIVNFLNVKGRKRIEWYAKKLKNINYHWYLLIDLIRRDLISFKNAVY